MYRAASDRKYIETALFMDSAAYRLKYIFNYFTSEKFFEKLKKVVTHIAKQTENIFLDQLSFFIFTRAFYSFFQTSSTVDPDQKIRWESSSGWDLA